MLEETRVFTKFSDNLFNSEDRAQYPESELDKIVKDLQVEVTVTDNPEELPEFDLVDPEPDAGGVMEDAFIRLEPDNPEAIRFLKAFAEAPAQVKSYADVNVVATAVFDGGTFYMVATAPAKGVSVGASTTDALDIERWMKPANLYRILGV